MGEFFAKVIELFTSGNRKVVFRLSLLLAIFLIGAPITVDYFFGYVRLEQQVRALTLLSQIELESIKDARLLGMYDRILDSLEKTPPANTAPVSVKFSVASFGSIFRVPNLWKFLTGASILSLLLVVVFFAKFGSIGLKVGAFFLILTMAFIAGVIGALIPTFRPIVINLLGFPLVQLIVLIYITIVSSKAREKKGTTNSK